LFESITNNNVTNKVVEVEDFTINDFEDALEIAIEKAEASVISVVHSEGNMFGATKSIGSAVVVKTQGKDSTGADSTDNISYYEYLAVTNRHVVVTNRNLITKNLVVYLGDGTTLISASVVDYSTKDDLALVSFKSEIYIPAASFADTTNLKRGSFVVAIGTPYDIAFDGSATFGIISHPLRYVEEEVFVLGSTSYETCEVAYIQHDAAINSGNSGGGLFNMEGKLLGINTMKIISSSSNVIEGMGFSVPIYVVEEVFKEYLK
jgi:serine protease Do